MYSFADLDETERVLDKLSQRPEGALARKLDKQAGQKEARFVQLLTGEPSDIPLPDSYGVRGQPSRLAELEAEVQQLRSDLLELRTRFDKLESELR
jgi:uncharacterized protein YceH (UPF0502 family)